MQRHRTRVQEVAIGHRTVIADPGMSHWYCTNPYGPHGPGVCQPLESTVQTTSPTAYTKVNAEMSKLCVGYESFKDSANEILVPNKVYPSRYRGKKAKPWKQKYHWAWSRPTDWHYNSCLHIKKSLGKLQCVALDLAHGVDTGFLYTPGAPGQPQNHHYMVSGSRFRFTDLGSFGVSPVTKDDESCFMSKDEFLPEMLLSLRREAMRVMVPNLENGFSLPVFIGELGDVRRMLGGILKGIQNLFSLLGDLISSPVRTISQHHLSTTFGWQPLERDVKAIITRILNLRKDVENFLKHAGIRNTFHYGRPLRATYYKPDLFVESDRVVNLPLGPGQDYAAMANWFDQLTFNVHKSVTVEDFSYHATLEFVYWIPDVGALEGALASLDRFGLNLSVSDIWELIPFSFVVDWFVNVQSILARFDRSACGQNLPVQVVISDFCDSIKFKYTEKADVSNVAVIGDFGLTSDGVSHVCAAGWTASPLLASLQYEEDAFYRWRTTPALYTEDFPGLTTPHGMQIVNGLALIGGNVF